MGSPTFEEQRTAVLDTKAPLGHRMRCIFYLRSSGSDEGVRVLCEALENLENSCLVRHELAYVLGQIGSVLAVPTLTETLRNTSDDPIVRHECAEALGAIAAAESEEVLVEFMQDPAVEVSETCRIAVDRVRWVKEHGSREGGDGNPFESVDPAPPTEDDTDVVSLQAVLVDEAQPLFRRYRAMFALRNLQTDASVRALAAGLNDTTSALFRHEVAYVLGQLAHSAATDELVAALARTAEHDMVRHEAAEALGAIGSPRCLEVLRDFAKDPSQVVRESCEVALDAADYWAADGTGPGTAPDTVEA